MPLERLQASKIENLGFLFLEGASESEKIRARLTLWDVLAELGGMLEIVLSFFPLFIGFYQQFAYDAGLAEALYIEKK